MRKRNRAVLFAGVVAVALVATACGGDQEAAPPSPAAGGPLQLKGVCPDTVVIQTDWVPQAEHGGIYRLLGLDYTIDADKKRVTGPLTASGKDTGVQLEVRAGGPAVGFQNASSQMYLDPSITLGHVATDEAVSLSATQPTIAVVAPMDISPAMIMWDPATHPEFKTIADIGRTNTKVLYYESVTYMEYLIEAKILRRGQVDGSYDGSPATFIASDGKIAQQGFATSEPYLYEKVLDQWKKPVKFQLLHETGYPWYSETLAIRSDQKKDLTPCLKKLVPIIQQSQVDYITNPKATNKLIVDLVDKYNVGITYSMDHAAFSVDQQRKLRIVGDGHDQTLGNFETGRLQRVIEIVTPIFTKQKKKIRAGMTPDDIATNEFIDPAIGYTP